MAKTLLASLSAGSMSLPKIEIYEGAMPASIGDVISGTLLASLDLSANVGVESNGAITFDPISEDPAANATALAGWARLLNRDGAEVLYLSVTQVGGGGSIQLNSANITAGLPVTITSGALTVGGQ